VYVFLICVHTLVYSYNNLFHQVKEKRRIQQIKHQAEYEQVLVSEKQLIETWRGIHMKEEIGDKVRIQYRVP